MAGSQQLLVLAIDAASPTLLRRWAADGSLPNIARLMSEGRVGDTRSVESFYTGSTWPSFYTASTPAHHGVYWLSQVEPGTYRGRPLPPEAFGTIPALWEVLSDAGKEVLVIDVPLSRLSPALNGAQVVEWNTHDVLFGFQASPEGFAARVQQLAGEHPVPPPCDAKQRNADQYAALANKLVAGASARARLTNALLAQQSWDFAIQVFSEAHCAGHQMWHTHDPAHPAYDAMDPNGDLVHRVYQAVDAAIGDVLANVSPETNVVLMSLHDMSYMTGWSALLSHALVRLGVMTRTPEPPTPTGLVPTLIEWLRTAYRIVPKPIRHALYEARTKARAQRIGGVFWVGIEPAQSQCFSVDMGPLVGGIRLNVRGREAQGVLDPADCEAFCDRLIPQLMALTHADTNAPLVQRVIRTTELFTGPRSDTLPDLIVEWTLDRALGSRVVGNGAASTLVGTSPAVGAITYENSYCRSGEHRPGGLFVARGPQVEPGVMDRAVNIYDLAPTFAAMVGSSMPSPVGVLIPELLRGDAHRSHANTSRNASP